LIQIIEAEPAVAHRSIKWSRTARGSRAQLWI